jgi:hypothetical protein
VHGWRSVAQNVENLLEVDQLELDGVVDLVEDEDIEEPEAIFSRTRSMASWALARCSAQG